jgi:hypothetical protein
VVVLHPHDVVEGVAVLVEHDLCEARVGGGVGHPLHLHRLVLGDALPRVEVDGDVVEQLPEHAVAEAVVVQVQ